MVLMRENTLLKTAKEVTGDDTITEVAVMQSKGATRNMIIGAVVGGMAGNAVGGGFGEVMGTAAGAFGAQEVRDATNKIPSNICLAVAPDKVYVLGHHSAKQLTPLVAIERSKLGVSLHNHLTIRRVVLEDLETQAKMELEIQRPDLTHGNAVIELLMLSPDHHEATSDPG